MIEDQCVHEFMNKCQDTTNLVSPQGTFPAMLHTEKSWEQAWG